MEFWAWFGIICGAYIATALFVFMAWWLIWAIFDIAGIWR